MDYIIEEKRTIELDPGGKPCVAVTKRKIDKHGSTIGEEEKSFFTISEIEDLVGFCIRCGNSELMRAVRRPIYKMMNPDHQFAKN